MNLNIDSEYDPSGNSNLSFHIGADILNLLFLYSILCYFCTELIAIIAMYNLFSLIQRIYDLADFI